MALEVALALAALVAVQHLVALVAVQDQVVMVVALDLAVTAAGLAQEVMEAQDLDNQQEALVQAAHLAVVMAATAAEEIQVHTKRAIMLTAPLSWSHGR